jgi:hypothetical protein
LNKHKNPTRIVKDEKGLSRPLTKEELEFAENLKSAEWRINNLYYIVDKHGKKIKFKMNWAQQIMFDGLWYFSIILKARQLGMTTFFTILYLDQVLFKSNVSAAIIAHTDADSKRIFERVKFAWNNLPELLRDTIGKPKTDSVGEMAFPNGSKIFVARSTRGGTLQYLHISEFAKICAKYPQKAKEIVTGAINSVEKGNFVTIESTAEGRAGYFFDYCMEAQNAQLEERELTEIDFKFFFFPWWKHPQYTLKSDFVITTKYEKYFENLEAKEKIKLTDGQKRWYISKKKTMSEDMFREYPSNVDEAFLASIEGAYYTTQMKKVYEENRIRNIPWDARLKVDTWWDLGMNDLNVILFTQAVGNEIRFIDVYYNSGEGLGHYVNVLNSKPYTYGKHVFPHDIEVRSLDEQGKSRRQTLMDLGMINIRTIERTKDINDDIEAVRKLFSRFYFDEAKTSELVNALNTYQKEWDDRLGQFKNRPRHDKSSHLVDPVRLIGRGWTQHMVDVDKAETKTVSFF